MFADDDADVVKGEALGEMPGGFDDEKGLAEEDFVSFGDDDDDFESSLLDVELVVSRKSLE